MILIEWIFNLALLLLLAVIVVGNIMRLIALFKCLRKRKCSDRSCSLKILCHRYQETITQEDLDCITKTLNERRRELEADDS